MKEDMPIALIIQKLKSKALIGKDLSSDSLLTVIEYLRGLGQGATTIADFLGYSSRQIRRFLGQIREKNRFEFTETFWGDYIGALLQKQELALDHLVRSYNDSRCSPETRIVACSNLLRYLSVCVRTLQSLGVLPTEAPAIKPELLENGSRPAQTYSDVIDVTTSDWGEACSEDEMKKMMSLTPLQRDEIRLKLLAFSREAKAYIQKYTDLNKERLSYQEEAGS